MKRFNLFVFCGHCIVFAVLLGSGVNIGFIVDTWFAPVFGYGSGIGSAVAVLSGLLVGMGAYGLFIHSEHALKTIMRLSDTEKWVRGISLILLNVMFVAMGIAGLAYRLSYLSSKGVGFLFVIGCVLEVCTPIFGLVMYPMTHPDVSVLSEDRMNAFERRTVHETWDSMDKLPVQNRFKALTSGYEDDGLLEEAINASAPVEKPKTVRRTDPLTRRMQARRISPPDLEEEEFEEDEIPNPFFEAQQTKGKTQR